MKRSIINFVVMVATGLGMALTAQTSQASEFDMRVGSFEGNWCNYAARFDITSQRGKTWVGVGAKTQRVKTWVFDGKILIKATGEYDHITVTQLADNSLFIVRHLSGSNSGKMQRVVTHPPTIQKLNNQLYVNFRVRSADGYGSAPLGHLNLPPFHTYPRGYGW